ncbi:MAG: HNH endonuclease [Cetobacterium sp.]
MNIQLTKGQIAIIDDADFERVSKFKWCAAPCGNVFYAKSQKRHMHRFLLGVNNKSQFVDHKNGNTLDNRRENLRLCTQADNNRNRDKNKNSNKNYKGVYFDAQTKSVNKYRLEFWFQNKRIKRKRFFCEKEAALAYNELAKQYYGEFAYLNKVSIYMPHWELT